MQNTEQQTNENVGTVSKEYFSIQDFSRYLDIKPSTAYALVEEKKIPHYRIGRLIRFKRSEIDQWMQQHKEECIDAVRVARKALRTARKSNQDIDRIVRKAVDGVKGRGYTDPTGKPDQVKGLGKEVQDGVV